jgi:hypothetical protein
MHSIFPCFEHGGFETHAMQQMFVHLAHWVLINLMNIEMKAK